MLVILKSMPVMLLLCSTNTKYPSKIFKSKPRDLQKIVRYLSSIVTSMFNVGTGSCGGQSASPSFLPYAGLASVFFCYFLSFT